MIGEWVAAALALAAVLWTALPLLRSDAWWVRAFEFPRVQVTVLTVAVLALYLLLAGIDQPRDVALCVALAGCVAFQLVRIGPYTPLWRVQARSAIDPRPEDTVRVLVANVLTPNRNADGLLRIIGAHGPDLVLAVETDAWWESRLDALVPDYPWAVRHPLDNLYGMHLYSLLELVDAEVRFLVEDDVPSVHATVVLRNGRRVDLHCLHPAPPSPTENPTAAERDAELLVVARALESARGPAIVLGDLNDVAWSATTRLFQRISGLLDPRVGRGMFSTFHADHPLLRWPLDHVFFSPDFSLVSMRRLPHFGSDHFPICVTLCHAPEAAAEHAPPEEPSGEDRALAEEKIAAVNADADADALR